MANKIELDIDFEELLPGETITIGSKTVVIRPLNFLQFAIISKKLKALSNSLGEKGINKENYESIDNMLTIAEVVLSDFPDLLEEASGISKKSLQQLPLEIIVGILNVIFTVNLKSKDTFMGNLKSLAGKVTSLLPKEAEGESEKLQQ